jgi:hypothetical protein
MGLSLILISLLLGYFFKDILKLLVIVGLVIFVATYKLESILMVYEAIVKILSFLKGVLV